MGLIVALAQQGIPPMSETPVNLDFHEKGAGQLPSYWRILATPKTTEYRVEIHQWDCGEATLCALLQSPVDASSESVGNLMQSFAANRYRGATVRVRAWMRVERMNAPARANLWFRVDRPGRLPGFLDNTSDRPVSSPEWQLSEIIGKVDDDARFLSLGVTFRGPGRMWVRDVSFDIVDGNTPHTGEGLPGVLPTGPVNLSFNDGTPGGTPARWFIPSSVAKVGNTAEFTRDGCRGANPCAVLASSASGVAASSILFQGFTATRYRGKTVRFHSWLRSESGESGYAARISVQVGREGSNADTHQTVSQPSDSGAWLPTEVVARIPADADQIVIGIHTVGQGRTWVDDVGFDIVPDGVPITVTTPAAGPATDGRPLAGLYAPLNLTFKDGTAGEAPFGWRLWPMNQGYTSELRRVGCASSAGCGVLVGPANPSADQLAALVQTFRADSYRGRLFRLRVRARLDARTSTDAARLEFTVYRPNQETGLHIDPNNWPILTAGWSIYEFKGRIDDDAAILAFGLVLRGGGMAWIDDVSFEVIPD